MSARSLLSGLGVVGFIGFGGGSALIPIIERELVVKRGLLDEVTYTRHTVVANITPGALPVKLASFAGAAQGRPLLSVLAAGTVAVPGVAGTCLFLAASEMLGEGAVRAITHASVGISVFITVLLLGYIWKVFAHAGPRWPAYLAIMLGSFVLTGAGGALAGLGAFFGQRWSADLPRITAVQLIVGALVLIVLGALAFGRRGSQGNGTVTPAASGARNGSVPRATLAFCAVGLAGVAVLGVLRGVDGLGFAGLLALSTVTSFGGGEAYIGVADGFFVQSGLVDRTVFYTQLVPVANALPGPILVKVGSGMGFMMGGSMLEQWLLAAAAAAITIGSCCALALPVMGAYERLRHHPVVVAIGHYILPVICGLLLTVCATMLEIAVEVIGETGQPVSPWLWGSVVAIVVMLWGHITKRVPDLVMLAVAGAISLVGLGLGAA